jgi:hypothetical protein
VKKNSKRVPLVLFKRESSSNPQVKDIALIKGLASFPFQTKSMYLNGSDYVSIRLDNRNESRDPTVESSS